MGDCLFCQISRGDIPTEFLYEDDQVVAFKDIDPQAPVHLLIVPKEHIGDITSLPIDNRELMPAVHKAVLALTSEHGIQADGFRVVVNSGPDGGQSVAHLHFHLLGGRQLNWPPG